MRFIIYLVALLILSFSLRAMTLEKEISLLSVKAEESNKASIEQEIPLEDTPFYSIYQGIKVRHDFLEKLKSQQITRYVIVNRDQYTLRVIDDKKEIINERIIVGRPDRKTPVFSSNITHIIFNPVFTPVPGGNIEKDLLDRLKYATVQTRDKFIKGMGYTFTRDNESTSSTNIDWNNVPKDLRIQQSPGLHNALGTIKFLLPNHYYIYIHDTPNKHLFDRVRREFSSGCIRMENPHRLASYLLYNDTTMIDKYMKRKNKWVRVSNPLPVYIVGGDGWNIWATDTQQVISK